MATPPTAPDALTLFINSALSLLPVVVGGLIAMIAALAGGLFQHRLKTRAEMQAYKRDKLERYVTLLNQLSSL